MVVRFFDRNNIQFPVTQTPQVMIGFLNQQQIEYLLRSEVVGHLGCSSPEQVYVVPITYVFDEKGIYAHTREGQKVDMMRENPRVCLEVDSISSLSQWQSVIVQGTFEELEGDAAEEALQKIVNRVHPLANTETMVPRHSLQRPQSATDSHVQLVVFKINILEASGKFEKP